MYAKDTCQRWGPMQRTYSTKNNAVTSNRYVHTTSGNTNTHNMDCIDNLPTIYTEKPLHNNQFQENMRSETITNKKKFITSKLTLNWHEIMEKDTIGKYICTLCNNIAQFEKFKKSFSCK